VVEVRGGQGRLGEVAPQRHNLPKPPLTSPNLLTPSPTGVRNSTVSCARSLSIKE
jgi:hypothetical protein